MDETGSRDGRAVRRSAGSAAEHACRGATLCGCRAEAQAHVDTIKDALALLRRFLNWDQALRRLDQHDLEEVASTRLLIFTARPFRIGDTYTDAILHVPVYHNTCLSVDDTVYIILHTVIR